MSEKYRTASDDDLYEGLLVYVPSKKVEGLIVAVRRDDGPESYWDYCVEFVDCDGAQDECWCDARELLVHVDEDIVEDIPEVEYKDPPRRAKDHELTWGMPVYIDCLNLDGVVTAHLYSREGVRHEVRFVTPDGEIRRSWFKAEGLLIL